MTSHELARLLLARRDNDIRFMVTFDDDPDAVRPYGQQLVQPYDQSGAAIEQFGPDTVFYDSEEDCVIIRTGVFVMGDEPQ